MRPISPAEILREEFMVPYDLTEGKLAKRLFISAEHAYYLLNGLCALSAEEALRLSRLFRTTPEFWMNMESTYRLRLAEAEYGKQIKKQIKPIKIKKAVKTSSS